MVLTLVWVHSWVVLAISICVLLVLGVFLMFCLCWQGKPAKPRLHKFYILDENGMKTTAMIPSTLPDSSSSVFRRLSNAEPWKINFKFPSANMNVNKMLSTYDKGNLITNEKELMDSLDIEKQFNDAVLQIDKNDETLEDAKSCGSNDSRYTFYSMYPRTNSFAETMRSASSYPEDLEKY